MPIASKDPLLFSCVLLLFPSVTGCAFKASAIPESAARPQVQTVAPGAKLVSGAEPNDYRVRLEWDGVENAETLLIRRTSENGQAGESAPMPATSRDYEDPKPVLGQSSVYTLLVATPSMRIVRQWRVDLPHDLEFSGRVLLKAGDFPKQVIRAGRIFLRADARVFTQGGEWLFESDEIRSEGALIGSFDTDQEASPGQDGRSGGHLEIRTQRGRGLLRVVARGERGGAGKKGSPGLRGDQGRPGQDSKVLKISLSPLGQGDRCAHEAEDGGAGAIGHVGERGNAGARGGDSGNVRIFVTDAQTPLALETDVQPGLGGRGGFGGAGGEGGPGGNPGLRLAPCPGEAQPGAQGPRGPVGLVGPSGESGIKGEICLISGELQSGSCRESSL